MALAEASGSKPGYEVKVKKSSKEQYTRRLLINAFFKIFRRAGAAVGGHGHKAPFRPHEALHVQRIQRMGKFPEHEIEAEGTFVAPERAEAEIARIVPKAQGAPGRTAYLPGNVAYAVERAGGNADGAFKVDVLFHERIHDAHAVGAAQSAAFQHKAARRDEG